MKMLDESISRQVQEMFAGMKNPVEMVYFGSSAQNCEYCEDTLTLVREVAALSEKISLSEHDLDTEKDLAASLNVDKAPMIVIATRDGEKLIDHGIRYAGIPAGSEFSTLINVLILVSNGDSGLSAGTREFLRTLEKPVHLQVFVTPT